MRLTIAATCLLLTALGAARAADAPPAYTLVATVALGAPERWDYVVFDAATNRVYVAHGSGLSVVDSDKALLVGTVGPFAGGTHGTGISIATGTGYTDDGKAGVAVPFDLKTLKAGTPIATAPDADGIAYDPASKHVLVINGDSGSVTAIDPATNAVVATIATGAGLEAGVADGHGKFFVDGVDNHDIVRIDTHTNAVDAHWPMPGCVAPHGIAMDIAARRLFATCANAVMVVVDADSGANLATLPIGKFSDGAAFDPVRKLAFSSNGDGTLSIVAETDAHTFVALPPVKTPPSARTMGIDPATGRLFLAAADILKIDPPATPGGRPHVTYVTGSLKLLILAPAK